MTQQAPSFSLMSDFNSVILTTNLPIQSEYVGQSAPLAIIQDYCPSDLNINTFSNNITYNSIFPYRQVSMLGTSPIRNMTFNCYTSDVAGNLTLMTIPPGISANIKLMFTKIK